MRTKKILRLASVILAVALIICALLGVNASATVLTEADNGAARITNKNVDHGTELALCFAVDPGYIEGELYLLVWNSDFSGDFTFATAEQRKTSLGDITVSGKTRQLFIADSVAAKDIDAPSFFRTCIKKADGSFVYGALESYSIIDYTAQRLAEIPNDTRLNDAEKAVQINVCNSIIRFNEAAEGVLGEGREPDDELVTEEDEEWLRRWDALYNELGIEGTAAVQRLYEFWGTEWLEWTVGLYDPESGGFYYSASSRDYVGFGADIESTAQILNLYDEFGLFRWFDKGELWTDMLPDAFRTKLGTFVQNMQSETDGYFYHPQWGTDIGASARGRHLDQAFYILWVADAEAPYKSPLDTVSTASSGTSAVIAAFMSTEEHKSTVALTASTLPDYMQSEEAFNDYLDKEWAAHYSESSGQNSYGFGHLLSSRRTQIDAAGLIDVACDWLDAHQDPETGFWEPITEEKPDSAYRAISGLIKIATVYGTADRPFLHADKMVDVAIDIMLSDVPPAHVCYVFNPIGAFADILGAMYDVGLSITEAKAKFYDRLPEIIDKTIEKQTVFRKELGSFSYTPDHSDPASQGLRISLGLWEGDVNGTAVSMHYVADALFGIFGMPIIPLFRYSDYEWWCEKIANAEPPEKQELILETLDFEDGEMPDRLFAPTTDVTTSIVDDGRGGNALEIHKGGSESSSAIFVVDMPASIEPTCTTVSLDMKFVSVAKEGYQYSLYIRNETGDRTGYELQLGVFGDKVQAREVIYPNGGVYSDTLFSVPAGDWFNLSIEYYPISKIEMRVKLFVNGNLVYIGHTPHNNHYDEYVHNGMNNLALNCWRGNESVVMLDNIYCNHSDEKEFSYTDEEILALNPYAGVDWSSAEQIKSMSHLHAFDQAKFEQALSDGYQHFAISHYAPSKPIYPLEDYFGNIPEGIIASPNTEKVYAYNSDAHFNSLGSFFAGGGHNTGAIASWQAMFDLIFDELQYTDGGGITLNHPGYPAASTVERYMTMLDYDPRVLGIEIYNDATNAATDNDDDGTYLEEWDAILSTGRKCWGFGVEDWHVTGRGWGSNILLVPAVTEEDALRAYRNGQFYVQMKDVGLRFTNLTLEGDRIYVSTNRETTIRFIGAGGTVIKTVKGTDAYYDVRPSDMYVRVEAQEGDDEFARIFSQPFMFVEDTRPERTHFHSYSEEWTSDANYHWHKATCDESEACPYMYTAKAAHTDENGDDLCDTCERKLAYTVTVNENSDKIELITTGTIGGAIGTDVYFTVAVDEGYDLIVGVGARIFGRPTVVDGKKQYTVKVTAITEDMTVTIGATAIGHFDYSTLPSGEASTKTSTVYYDPATATYSDAATGAEGEITYTVVYKNGATLTNDTVNNTYTIDKSISIVSVSGSDGSTALTFNGSEYGAGDLIPYRTWLFSTNTGSNPRAFPSATLHYTLADPTVASPTDDAILYEFETDIVVSHGNGDIGNVVFVQLMGSDGNAKALTIISRVYGNKLAFYAPSTTTSASASVTAAFDTKISYRITVSESREAGKVDVTLYINGTQVGNVLTTDAFDASSVKLAFQDDGKDRNYTVTLSDTYFTKYEVDYKELEPSATPSLPTVGKEGATVTKTLYASRGSYTLTEPEDMTGYTTYTVTYKNGVDVTVNPDGSVTYSKVASIVSLKDADGNETTISFGGKTFGASGDGVTTVIPTRDWLGTNAGFRGDGDHILWNGSGYGYVYPTEYTPDSEVADLVGDIISVVEFDMTVSSDYENDNSNNAIFSIVHIKAGDSASVTLHMQRRNGAIQIQNNNDNYTWYKVAEIGEIFTIRIEYKKNGDGFDYVYYANGEYLFTKTVTADNACNGGFGINLRDDGSSNRNHIVTVHSFKYLEYVHSDAE